ncbi:MAG: hypothetical protein J7L20_04400, partial [Thermoplasmata archaeon]|nr:hypothetical protein [Thermoplasmata archaeon]
MSERNEKKIKELIKKLEELEGGVRLVRAELSKLIGEKGTSLIREDEQQRANILFDIWKAGSVITQRELY